MPGGYPADGAGVMGDGGDEGGNSTRNSTTANASMPAYCIGNSPAVRWNIWMNANALIAMAISNKEI